MVYTLPKQEGWYSFVSNINELATINKNDTFKQYCFLLIKRIPWYLLYFYDSISTHKTIIMNSKNVWLRIAGTIFGVVAILHLLRIITSVPVLIGGWSLPVCVNWMGLVATVFLCIWLWRISNSGK